MQYFSQEAAENAPEFQAQGYVYHSGEYKPVPFMDLKTASGAGAIASNVLDYAKVLFSFFCSLLKNHSTIRT